MAADRIPLHLGRAASKNAMAKVSLSSLPYIPSAARLCFHDYSTFTVPLWRTTKLFILLIIAFQLFCTNKLVDEHSY